MALNRKKLLGITAGPSRVNYTRRDSRLYALSVGFGSDPLFEPELDFVTDRTSFKIVPSMASIFATVIIDLTEACELDHPELELHGEQKLEILQPLPDHAELEVTGSIPAIFDRGEKRGAEIHMQAEARIAGQGEPLYRATYVTIARGDGGFDGPPPEHRPVKRDIPDRAPDHVFRYPCRPDQALLYALNGDPNPIHTQPRIAATAGFRAPILHGLCTYGIACRALLATCCSFESNRIREFDARFSSPVTPGDLLVFDFWKEDNAILFQASNENDGRFVLKNGWCRLS